MRSPGVCVNGGVGDGEAVRVGVSVDVGASAVAVGEGGVTAGGGEPVARGAQAATRIKSETNGKSLRQRYMG